MSKSARFIGYAYSLSLTTPPHYSFHWQHRRTYVRVFHLPASGMYLHQLVRQHRCYLSQLPF